MLRQFIRWWDSLGKAERIVALAIGLSAPVAIINSTVWAFAVAYMSHQKALVAIERARLEAIGAAGQLPPDSSLFSASDPASR